MNKENSYKPQAIPARTKTEENEEKVLNRIINLPVFAELTVASNLISENTPVAEALSEPADEIRSRFYAMRKIATEQFSYMTDRSVVFYYQAEFMKDYEDDYPHKEHFSAYFPYYQLMGYGQLRSYFSWRTRVRKGDVTRTSLSYVFLYIYELLNNIGTDSPQDGLDKLMNFWTTYQQFTDKLDEFVLPWLKDYHIYYPLEQSFIEFVKEHGFEHYYPTIFAYRPDRANSLAIYNELSSYKILDSKFYGDDTKDLIEGCFHHILARIEQLFEDADDRFERLFLYRYAAGNIFIPFNHAIFYTHLKQQDRKIVLSDGERYSCVKNRFYFYTATLSKTGERMLGYIIKEMESTLRTLTGFRHKIKAVKNDCDFRLRDQLLKVGIAFPDFVVTETQNFYRLHTKKEVTIDPSRLLVIRQEALHTQNSLIVPEDVPVAVPVATKLIEPQTNIGFKGFVDSLNGIELEALKLIINGNSIKSLVLNNGIMPEVLIDEINQKAADSIGDTIIEADIEPIVYDDYIKDLKEVIK